MIYHFLRFSKLNTLLSIRCILRVKFKKIGNLIWSRARQRFYFQNHKNLKNVHFLFVRNFLLLQETSFQFVCQKSLHPNLQQGSERVLKHSKQSNMIKSKKSWSTQEGILYCTEWVFEPAILEQRRVKRAGTVVSPIAQIS